MQIQTKLIIALSFLGVSICIALYFFMQWSFDRGLVSYLNQQEKDSQKTVVERLANFYKENNGWSRFENDPRSFHRYTHDLLASGGFRPPPPHADRRPPGGHKGRPPRPGRPPPPISLLNADGDVIVGKHRDYQLTIPILVDGVVVGKLALPKPQYPLSDFNLSIRENLDITFVLLGVVLLISILCVGVPLSRHFVTPLKKLTNAMDALTAGQYSDSITINRNDEIGQLAKDFSLLSETLKNNESSRSRWIAGISHELRTPLAITLGEVEAMLEDVRPLNKENLLSVKQEVETLNRLVDDLYELSNAEIGALRYNLKRVDLRTIVSHGAQRFEDLLLERSITFNVNLASGPVWIEGDIQRLNQLMNNLMTNEIKYADEHATVHLMLKREGGKAILIVEDSGPGVSEEELPKLFDHLYRGESIQVKKVSGSGLGLAICRKIVEAHLGEIEAGTSPLGGVQFIIKFSLTR